MTECFSFEEISDAAFGKRYRKFTGVMFIIVCFGFVQFYFTMAVDQYAALVNHEIKVTQSTVYYNSLFVLLIYWIVTVIPLVVFVRTLRHLVVTSLIALSCVVLLIAYTIYVFVGQLKFDGGFDPYNQMVWGRNLAIGKTFQSFLLAYTFSPMVLNALRGLEGISVSGATKLSMGVMAAGFVVYAIFGIFPYFTLFDTNTGKTWLSYFSQPAETRFTGSRAFNIFSLVVALIFLDGSIIIYLQPGVESLMMLMNKNPREYPRLQIVLQLVCSLVLLILGVIHEHVNKVIVLVTDLACVCIIYGMPVIAYIRVKGLEDLKLFIMAIVIAIIGLICFGFSLWSSIDTW